MLLTETDCANRRRTAQLLALSARHGVEDLHAAGVFSDAQAPVLNSLLRNRIYEALLIFKVAGQRNGEPSGDQLSQAAIDWIVAISDFDETHTYKRTLLPICEAAVGEFSASIGLPAEQARSLQAAACAGLSATLDLIEAAERGDEDAQRRLGYLELLLPAYWEEPRARPQMIARFGLRQA